MGPHCLYMAVLDVISTCVLVGDTWLNAYIYIQKNIPFKGVYTRGRYSHWPAFDFVDQRAGVQTTAFSCRGVFLARSQKCHSA